MKLRLILATVAICASLPLSAAHTTPQLLGLFAECNLPLHCTEDNCSVEVSAICLEKERDMPAREKAYRALQPDQMKVVGIGSDGSAAEWAIGDIVHIESDRDSWAIKISIPEASVRAMGVSQAALAIERRVALSPVSVADDRNPQTATEIDTSVTAFVNSSEAIIGDDSGDMAAAHVLNEIINALPHITLNESKPAGNLWRKVFGPDPADGPGMKRAAAYCSRCGHELLIVDRPMVRRRLELGHDGFLTTINKRYWDANKPGI